MARKPEPWDEIKAEAEQRAQARGARNKAREEARASRDAFKEKLELAGYGTEQDPILPRTIGPRFRGDLEADNHKWAGCIIALARLWKELIGLERLELSPLRHSNLGARAGYVIFCMAAEGSPKKVIAAELAKARAALGKWDRHASSLGDSELGLAQFFRTLPELFTNKHWAPIETAAADPNRTSSKKAPIFADERPRSFGDAQGWWVTSRAFMILIGKSSDPQLRVEIKRQLPPPLGRKQGSEGYWQLATLLQAAERVLSRHEGRPVRLAHRDLGPEWKRYLKPPNFHQVTLTP